MKNGNVRETQRFIVRKEPFQKVITSTVVTDKPVPPERNGPEVVRQKRSVQSVVRWFQRAGARKTCSVFGAKGVGTKELALMRLVARQLHPDIELHFVGVAEYAETGEHAHLCVFKVVDDEPYPLDAEEEETLCRELNLNVSAFLLRRRDDVTPFRWLRQVRRLDVLEETGYWKVVYRVPMIRYQDGGRVRRAISGMQHYAIAYTVKTLLKPEQGHLFRGSVGLSYALAAAKKTQEVRVKEKTVVNLVYATYRMDLISYLAYEAEKQLRYREPKDVSAYLRYNKLFVSTEDWGGGNNLRLCNDMYLLIGLELLRRYLQDFDGASVLRRATNKVCKLMCKDLRKETTDDLEALARKHKSLIRHKTMLKRKRTVKRMAQRKHLS